MEYKIKKPIGVATKVDTHGVKYYYTFGKIAWIEHKNGVTEGFQYDSHGNMVRLEVSTGYGYVFKNHYDGKKLVKADSFGLGSKEGINESREF